MKISKKDGHSVAYAPNYLCADNFVRGKFAPKEQQRTAYYKSKGHIWELDRYGDSVTGPRDMGDEQFARQYYPNLARKYFSR